MISILDEFNDRLARSWDEAALMYYSFVYRLHREHDTSDLTSLWSRRLQETMPEAYKSGVHLLKHGAACMGEDVFVVDGEFQHALHSGHAPCHTFSVVMRVLYVQSRVQR